jgi:hypothetical protein
MTSITVAVVFILAIVVMVPVFIIGIIADSINRWVKEQEEDYDA